MRPEAWRGNDACVTGLDCNAIGDVLAVGIENKTNKDFESCRSGGGNAQSDVVRCTG